MKHKSYLFAAILVTPILANCSHHPIPRDVIRKATQGIVNSIRCETRRAIEIVVADEFKAIGKKYKHQKTLDLAKDIEEERIKYSEFKRRVRTEAHRKARAAFNRYREYALAYNFDFTITEDNDEMLNLAFAVPVPQGTFTLGLGGGHARKRNNVRTVQAQDTFEELFIKLNDQKCALSSQETKNWDYPIAGKIGMEELVRTFINLNDDLRSKAPGASSVGVDKFSDELTYTTTYSGSVSPKVTLAPVTDKFHLTQADGKLSASRTDKHKVELAFSTPPKKTQKTAALSAGQRAKRKARKDLNFLVQQQFIQDTRDRNEQ